MICNDYVLIVRMISHLVEEKNLHIQKAFSKKSNFCAESFLRMKVYNNGVTKPKKVLVIPTHYKIRRTNIMVRRKKQLWLRISSLMLVFVFMVASSNISAMAATVLSISAKASTNEVSLGQKVVLSATAKGGSGNYTYGFLVYNKSTGEWARLTDSFTKNNSFTWKAQTEGKREFYVEVKDSAGKK